MNDRVQLGKQFGGRDSVKDLGLITHGKTDGPWASSSCVHFEQSPLPVMGALNGNPSIRSSTGAGTLLYYSFFFFFFFEIIKSKN